MWMEMFCCLSNKHAFLGGWGFGESLHKKNCVEVHETIWETKLKPEKKNQGASHKERKPSPLAMIGSTVTTFGKIDNAERGTNVWVNGHCGDLALTKYEAVILSLPSFSPTNSSGNLSNNSQQPLSEIDFTAISMTSLPHYLQPTSTTSLSCLLPFLKDHFKSLQHPKKTQLATKVLVLLPIIVKRTNLGICEVLVFFAGD